MKVTQQSTLTQQLLDERDRDLLVDNNNEGEHESQQQEQHGTGEEELPPTEHPQEQQEDENSSTTSMPSNFVTNCIFYLLGIGLLVPWNAFVSAKPYFSERLCGSASVELWFGLVYNVSSVLSLGVLLFGAASCACAYWCRRRRPVADESDTVDATPEPVSTYWMVMIPLAIYLSVFFLTALLVFVPLVEGVFLIVTLLSLSVCGAMVAIASAGMVATASSVGSVGPLFSGQAVGGVVVSSVNFLAAIWESPDNFWKTTCAGHDATTAAAVTEIESDQAFAFAVQGCAPYDTVDWAVVSYFGLGCVLLAACLVGYHYLHQSSSHSYEQVQDVEPEQELTTDESPRFVADLDVEHQHQPPENLTTLVWKKIHQPAMSIFLNFVVTLAMFPAWTASLKSTEQCTSHSRILNDLYTPLTFVWFNVFDLLGRLLAERYSYLLSNDNLVAYSFSRSIFFLPFLLLPSNRTTRITSIPSDILSLVVQAAFALSNGFVLSWSFLVAPTLIKQQERLQVRSSEILNFALALGLLCGSLLSFIYSRIAAVD